MKNHTFNDQDLHVSFCVDLTEKVGYPLSIYINSIEHNQPLFWQSWNNNDLLEDSTFLQGPGLPLAMLLPDEQLNSIPKEVLAITGLNPEKQYQLLQSMLISPAATQLALSNTLLFMLLVRHAQQHNLNEQSFKALVLQKRTEILRHLQLPSSNSIVKMLARIDLTQQYIANLNAVFEVLSDAELAQHLRHVPHLCMNHFLFLQRYHGLCWSGLLNMICPQTNITDMGYIRQLAQDSCALGANLDSLRLTTTLEQLKNLHDRFVLKHNRISVTVRAQQHQRCYGDFPTPPLPGNQMIVPISSWLELALEGLHMRHCVGAYHQRIYAGKFFIYQVLTTPRVTLSLRAQGNDWLIDEARSYANTPPSKEAMLLVHNWLNDANKNNHRPSKQ